MHIYKSLNVFTLANSGHTTVDDTTRLISSIAIVHPKNKGYLQAPFFFGASALLVINGGMGGSKGGGPGGPWPLPKA